MADKYYMDESDFIFEMIQEDNRPAFEIFDLTEEELDIMTDEWWREYDTEYSGSYTRFCSAMKSWWEMAREDEEDA